MDTTTVNFAIAKMDSLVRVALPSIKEGGLALVDYNILLFIVNELIAFIIPSVVLILSTVLVWSALRYRKKTESYDYINPDSSGFLLDKFLFLTIGGCVWFISFIIALCEFPEIGSLVVAIKHPVIFTIMKFSGK